MHLTATPDLRVGNGCFVPHLISSLRPFSTGIDPIKNYWGRLLPLIIVLTIPLTQAAQAQVNTGLSVIGNTLMNNVQYTPSGNIRVADCPSITNTDVTAIEICSGQLVSSLEVNTTATTPANLIEYVRFDAIQANPYLGKNGVHMVEAYPYFGKAISVNVAFPANTTTVNKVYYVYACLKPEPDISVCSPFALITVTIKPQPPKCLPVVIQRTKISRTGPR